MTVYLIVKKYTGESNDYDDNFEEPIGYRLSLSLANEDVERLNKENKLLIIKQEYAFLCMKKWENENPNPILFKENGKRKNLKELKIPIDQALLLDWKNRNKIEKNKYSDVLYTQFEKISYIVKPLDEFQQ